MTYLDKRSGRTVEIEKREKGFSHGMYISEDYPYFVQDGDDYFCINSERLAAQFTQKSSTVIDDNSVKDN